MKICKEKQPKAAYAERAKKNLRHITNCGLEVVARILFPNGNNLYPKVIVKKICLLNISLRCQKQ